MAEPRSTMIEPPIEALLAAAGSKFTLVVLSSKRGRQINSYFNQLGEGLGAIVPPQVASIARKPLTIALEEIATGKVKASYPDPVAEDVVGEGGEEAEIGGDAAGTPGLAALASVGTVASIVGQSREEPAPAPGDTAS